jgi:hypothetical protein
MLQEFWAVLNKSIPYNLGLPVAWLQQHLEH